MVVQHICLKANRFLEDTFGLRSLKEAGKLHLETVKGVVHEDWCLGKMAVLGRLFSLVPEEGQHICRLKARWLGLVG